MTKRRLVGAAAVAVVVSTGCSGAEPTGARRTPAGAQQNSTRAARATKPPATPTKAAAAPGRGSVSALVRRYGDFPAFAATGVPAAVVVRAKPGGKVVHSLDNPQPSGAPLTFLVKRLQGSWLEVYLPGRPNGSTGWIRSRDVTVAGISHRVDVHVGDHRLDLFEGNRRIGTYPIGVGTQNTPTPGGVFYLKELLRPTNKGGVYGPFAYGLSGFSNVLTKFGGGEGVIGIHGTNDESTIGKDVSHGCIRLRNADITRLATLLPLGTPVRIIA